MRKLNVFLFLLGLMQIGFAQKIHSPAELLKIATDSKMAFNVSVVNAPVSGIDYSNNLNGHGYYRTMSNDSVFSPQLFKTNEKGTALFEKAESLFESNPDSALYFYQKHWM